MNIEKLINNLNATIGLQLQSPTKLKKYYSYYALCQWVKISNNRTDMYGNPTVVEHFVDMETAARISIIQENAIPTRSPIDSKDQVLQFNAIADEASIKRCELGMFCDLLEKSGVKLGNITDELDNRVQYVREIAVRRPSSFDTTPRHTVPPWKITFNSQLQYEAFCKYVGENL